MSFIPEEEVEDFAYWAFGDKVDQFVESEQFAKAWNQMHGDLYMVSMSEEIYPSLEKMAKLWKNRK